jgi:hypothetical protein
MITEALGTRESVLYDHHCGYDVWIGEVAAKTGLEISYSGMTPQDVERWDVYVAQWESLPESEKCQYDILAVLGRT